MISVAKNTISGILSRNPRRFECGKVPNRVDRNRPKEQYSSIHFLAEYPLGLSLPIGRAILTP
ncbi:MAG: hypothetical protein WA764_14945, partial [Pseudolabrys sp.]